MSHISSELKEHATTFKNRARDLNFQAMLRAYAPIAIVGLVVVVVLWIRFF